MTQKNTLSFYAFSNSYYLYYITFKSTYSEKQFCVFVCFLNYPICQYENNHGISKHMAFHTFNACIIHFRWLCLVHWFAVAILTNFFRLFVMNSGMNRQTEVLSGGERLVKEKGMFKMSNLFKCVLSIITCFYY